MSLSFFFGIVQSNDSHKELEMSYTYNVPGYQFKNTAEARKVLQTIKGENIPTTDTCLQSHALVEGNSLHVKSPFSPSELLDKNLSDYTLTTVEIETPEETNTEKVKELQQKLEEAAAIALEIKDYTVLSSISNVLSIL